MENNKNLSQFLNCNGLLSSFRYGSASIINNFLHDHQTIIESQKMIDLDIDAAMDSLLSSSSKRNFNLDKFKKTIYNPVIYHPITPEFIERIIEIDSVFRASSKWNTEPITVYRGAPPLNENAFCGIVSTSLDIDVAAEFYKGALLKIDLPKGFQYINMQIASPDPVFDHEKEIILPPCNFKVVGKFTLPHIDFPDKFPNFYKCYEISVEPKSLAKCLLEKMKKPPKDYLQFLSKEDKLKHDKSIKILKDYIKNYVNKGKIKLDFSEESELEQKK